MAVSKPSKAEIKRIILFLKKSKKKSISLEQLSHMVGQYPDVLGLKLAYFSPMIMMDPEIDIKGLLPDLEEYVKPPKKEVNKIEIKKDKKPSVSKKVLIAYPSISSFVYQKMTSIGGLVDQSIYLSDHDLAILSRLIELEIKARKKKK